MLTPSQSKDFGAWGRCRVLEELVCVLQVKKSPRGSLCLWDFRLQPSAQLYRADFIMPFFYFGLREFRFLQGLNLKNSTRQVWNTCHTSFKADSSLPLWQSFLSVFGLFLLFFFSADALRGSLLVTEVVPEVFTNLPNHHTLPNGCATVPDSILYSSDVLGFLVQRCTFGMSVVDLVN